MRYIRDVKNPLNLPVFCGRRSEVTCFHRCFFRVEQQAYRKGSSSARCEVERCVRIEFFTYSSSKHLRDVRFSMHMRGPMELALCKVGRPLLPVITRKD